MQNLQCISRQSINISSGTTGFIPAEQRVKPSKMEALQNMGTEQDPKRQLIHSLIVRCRAYQTKRQGGAGRGLFRKSMRWTRCAGMYKCRRSQEGGSRPLVCPKCGSEMSKMPLVPEMPVVKVIAVITDPFEVNKIPLMPEKKQCPTV